MPVLRGVDLRVDRGEFVALMGRTGAGKTTLCLSFNGLVPQATGGVIRGRVLVQGRDTRRFPPASFARDVGMVFQDPESQLFQLTVEDEIAFGLENLGVPPDEIDRRIDWALSLVGMEGYRRRSPRRLSGGQMQRIAIAAALATRPALLVLDEPTTHLDPRGKSEVFHSLRHLRQILDCAVVMATQDVEWIVSETHRVAMLLEGRLAFVGGEGDGLDDLREAHWLYEYGIPQVNRIVQVLLPSSIGLSFASIPKVAEALRPARWHPPERGFLPANSPPDGPSVVKVEGLDFVYPNGVRALSGLSLDIKEGEYVALIGPNGAGKSTLARVIMGLLSPTQGRVLVCGQDTRSTPVSQLARLVGYAFQNPDHQIFSPTVREEIAFGPRNVGCTDAEVREIVDAMLARFHLEPLADIPPSILGYGLRRKVAVAAVAAVRPRVLILDEPTGGLDRVSANELLDFVDELHQQGTTIILITHDMTTVAERAHRCIVLVDGRLLFDDTPRQVFDRPDILKAASLMPPPVTRLAQALDAPPEISPILTAEEFLQAWAGGPDDER